MEQPRATSPARPKPHFSAQPYKYDAVPKRDERFQDSYNAGVNPEAFLYDERFAARDKTVMMFYKRLREIDVPEMMASIIAETPGKPWGYYLEMSRQLWDEARHAMMGEVGFASLGIDWTKIPINFTWSLNLNTQLNAIERHAVLYFIEQGLMPRTGKRYEFEVGTQSGQPLSGLFQDFDWADEVLHARIGRDWYVKDFANLKESLDYGDRCWTKVVSHWRRYLEEGLTQHRNWWPDIYRAACEHWGVSPDPVALAFDTTYETQRADLKLLVFVRVISGALLTRECRAHRPPRNRHHRRLQVELAPACRKLLLPPVELRTGDVHVGAARRRSHLHAERGEQALNLRIIDRLAVGPRRSELVEARRRSRSIARGCETHTPRSPASAARWSTGARARRPLATRTPSCGPATPRESSADRSTSCR